MKKRSTGWQINLVPVIRLSFWVTWSILLLIAGYWIKSHWQIAWLDSRLGAQTEASQVSSQEMKNTIAAVKNSADLDELWFIWGKMKQEYIDKDKLDDKNMIYGAIKGLVAAAGDPYTVFLTPEENTKSREDLAGEFSGVGIQIGFKRLERLGEDRLAVISPLEGMPAQKAGIKAGDFILEIDGEPTDGLSLPEAVQQIRGPVGSEVTLTVWQEGDDEPREITVVRDVIKVPSVKLKMVEYQGQQIAHLRVARFGERTIEEVTKAEQEIKSNPQVAGIVLDMRYNPGGYFDKTIELVSKFVKSGVVVQQEDSQGRRKSFRVNGAPSLIQYPLVVLVNQGTASSAEISAGALRELRGVQIVGTKTFGKGTVQRAENLPDGAGIHITSARWLLPSGESIDKVGIEPDVEVALDASASAGQEIDNQLETAIKVLLEE